MADELATPEGYDDLEEAVKGTLAMVSRMNESGHISDAELRKLLNNLCFCVVRLHGELSDKGS